MISSTSTFSLLKYHLFGYDTLMYMLTSTPVAIIDLKNQSEEHHRGRDYIPMLLCDRRHTTTPVPAEVRSLDEVEDKAESEDNECELRSEAHYCGCVHTTLQES